MWFGKPLKQSVLVSEIISCVTMTSEKSGFYNDSHPVEQLPWARNTEYQDQPGKRSKYKYRYGYKYKYKYKYKSGFNNDGRPVEQLPWARNGFATEHQDQARKRNKYKYKYKQ